MRYDAWREFTESLNLEEEEEEEGGSEGEGLKLSRTEVEGGKMRGEADPAGMSTIHKFRARTSPLPRPLLETFSVSEYCLHSQKLSCLSPPTNTRESNTNICDGVFDSNMAGGC